MNDHEKMIKKWKEDPDFMEEYDALENEILQNKLIEKWKEDPELFYKAFMERYRILDSIEEMDDRRRANENKAAITILKALGKSELFSKK